MSYFKPKSKKKFQPLDDEDNPHDKKFIDSRLFETDDEETEVDPFDPIDPDNPFAVEPAHADIDDVNIFENLDATVTESSTEQKQKPKARKVLGMKQTRKNKFAHLNTDIVTLQLCDNLMMLMLFMRNISNAHQYPPHIVKKATDMRADFWQLRKKIIKTEIQHKQNTFKFCNMVLKNIYETEKFRGTLKYPQKPIIKRDIIDIFSQNIELQKQSQKPLYK